MQQNYPVLDLMLKDMETADALYRPTHFWEKGMAKLLESITINGVEAFRSMESAMHFFVPAYSLSGYSGNTEMQKALKDLFVKNEVGDSRWILLLNKYLEGETQAFNDYRVFLTSDQATPPYLDRVSESTVGNPSEQFVFDGRNFSRSFLNYLLGLSCLKQHCDLSSIRTVLEIGGGFGTLGEILLGDERNHCFYIDVDIPPTSFVATYYLQQVFGNDAIGDYKTLHGHEILDIENLRARYQGTVLCPWQMPKLKGSIDLFVNYISFQEMEPNVVKNYLEQVDRLEAKYLLLRNMREGKQKAKDKDSLGVREPIKGADYDTYLPNYVCKTVNTVPFGFLTVDNFHSEIRIYERR